jgi:hypothetical protein
MSLSFQAAYVPLDGRRTEILRKKRGNIIERRGRKCLQPERGNCREAPETGWLSASFVLKGAIIFVSA